MNMVERASKTVNAASEAGKQAGGEGFLRSFSRGLSVISTLGKLRGRRTISTVAEATGLPRAVVRRILSTLCELQYAHTDGREYQLTPKVLTLGLSYLASLPYLAYAQQALSELSAEIGESCAMAVMDGNEAVFILRIPSRKVLSPNLVVGSRLPAYATSPGRMLLSQLDEAALERYLEATTLKPYTERTPTSPGQLREALARVREKGYAWVDRELDPAVAGLSVPLRDRQRQVVAALSVNVIAEGWTEERAVDAYLIPMRRAAECIRME
jgi:IclR family pca regulon transcriptional regulator